MCEQVIERVSGQIQSPAGLVRVEKSDHVQAKVPLEPLDVRVRPVKYLRAGERMAEEPTRSTNVTAGKKLFENFGSFHRSLSC